MSRTWRIAVAPVLASIVLVLTGGTGAALKAPPLTIGGISVDGNAATVTGAVNDPVSLLQINGETVAVDDAGTFVAHVPVDASALTISLLDSPHELVEIVIPIDVLLDAGDEGVLGNLVAAGVEIVVPEDGFQVVDGQMPVVEGRALDDSRLSALEINGADVLDRLGPDGRFSIALPGASHEHVAVTAVDKRGVTQTTTFKTVRVSSAIRTRAGTSVSAAGAQGLVLAKVRLDAHRLKQARYLRVTVTVRDRRGYFVRGAALKLRAQPTRDVANGATCAGFTNRVGQSTVVYRVRADAFRKGTPKILSIRARASTPRATATRLVTLRLPTLPLR